MEKPVLVSFPCVQDAGITLVFKFSISRVQGNSYAQQLAPLDWWRTELDIVPGRLVHRLPQKLQCTSHGKYSIPFESRILFSIEPVTK